MTEEATELARRFTGWARSAVLRSSDLYATLLGCCAADLAREGPTWHLLQTRAREPAGDALHLRLLAAVHRLVLTGAAPELSPFYPSVGGEAPPAGAWAAFQALLVDSREELASMLDRPLQTNEVRRCSALLVGFGWIAAQTGLPLATYEIGASAGLSLNWHRYRYAADDAVEWGPVTSPVRLELPSGLPAATVAPRLGSVSGGCDRSPLDVGDPDDRLWLRACIWGDHVDRLRTLDAALAIAEKHPPAVEASDAVAWLSERLARRLPDTVTVVVQTIVDQYLTTPQRQALTAVVECAGGDASRSAPLAWLQLEPPAVGAVPAAREGLAELRVQLWPGATKHLLGYAGYHGQPVQLGGGS